MKIGIVDDEEMEHARLKFLISKWAEKHCLSVDFDMFQDGNTFLSTFEKTHYDVVFLDIYMGTPNGIETARKIRNLDKHCVIVFMTSSMEHWADAFSVRAFDYLIKPVKPEQLECLLDEIKSNLPDINPYINLTIGKHLQPVLFKEICYVQSDSQYCIIHGKTNYRCRMPFRNIENSLCEDERFLSINRGILINMDYVKLMEKQICEMQDGTILPLNTRKEASLRQTYNTYCMNRKSRQV